MIKRLFQTKKHKIRFQDIEKGSRLLVNDDSLRVINVDPTSSEFVIESEKRCKISVKPWKSLKNIIIKVK